MTKHNYSAADMQRIINKESGVYGTTGASSDMRDLEAAVEKGDERAILALDMYEQRILKYVGAYAAEMGGVDIIVFTGGVGENQVSVRETVCKNLAFIGVDIDSALNATIHGKEAEISTPASKVKVCIIPTDEELMIARDTREIVSKL
jgi:acetate kinase